MILTIATAVGLSPLSNPFMAGSIESTNLYRFSDDLRLMVEPSVDALGTEAQAEGGAFLPDCRTALCVLMHDSEPMDPFLVLAPPSQESSPTLPMSGVLRPEPALQLGMRP